MAAPRVDGPLRESGDAGRISSALLVQANGFELTLSRYPFLAAFLLTLSLTIFLTWPQALNMRSAVAAHNDSYFSMWRLGWIAHALKVDPRHLYDANIYYPERGTLAYSDAIIFEGVVAAPLLWVGWSPVLVYNVMLFAGIVGSGFAMFVLARYLIGHTGPALVSAAIFTLAPYRVEHFMHLELQWTIWMPLAFWATHRTVAERSWRFGALAGAFLWLQILSCVYYGLFLALMMVLLGSLLIATDRRGRCRSLAMLSLGAGLAFVLSMPYARLYVEASHLLGSRDVGEVTRFSARWLSYVTAPYQNWLWGWTADRFLGEELRLTPGLVTSALAGLALIARGSKTVWIYALLCAAALELSLGLNGHVYGWLHGQWSILGGLRAIARFSILAVCAAAVLAGFGVRWIQERFSASRPREWVVALVLVALIIECGSAPMRLVRVPSTPPTVYTILTQLPPGVVVELPMPEPQRTPGYDPMYQFWSMTHWNSLVNGYSGYASARFVDTLRTMLTFPDAMSIARLKELNVRYILVHERLYDKEADFRRLILEMAGREELIYAGRYRDWVGNTLLFELK